MAAGGGAFNPDLDYDLAGTVTFTQVPNFGTSGAKLVTTTSTQTQTNKTFTSPTLTSPTITGTTSIAAGATIDSPTITGTVTQVGVGGVQAAVGSAFSATSGTTGTTLTNITGLTAFSLVAGATYIFEVFCPVVTMTVNCGLKMAFKLTTATLTSINGRVFQSTDTDNTGAVSTNFTTTTDQATWFAQNAVVYTQARIKGSLVCGTAGTIAVQAAQNASHADTTAIAAGAFGWFRRVA